MPARIMAHLVCCYPDGKSSHEIARGLVHGGASYLEVQFPFSDPTADGAFIQKACDQALASGFSVQKGFSLVAHIREITDIPIFIMGYANTVYCYGIRRFVRETLRAGAQGLIIPDLSPGYDEGLFALGREKDVCIVPVICPTISADRFQTILSLSPRYVYTTLRKGITGAYTQVGTHSISYLKRIKTSGPKIFAGFGISTKEQVRALAPFVHAVVVGSAFIEAIVERGNKSCYEAVKEKMTHLLSESSRMFSSL
jgi:tryptophan synthase alpha chain